MARPYDPLPDLAAVLAGMYQIPAHMMTAGMIQAFGRLADTLWPGAPLRLPDAMATEIQVHLRRVLAGRGAGGA